MQQNPQSDKRALISAIFARVAQDAGVSEEAVRLEIEALIAETDRGGGNVRDENGALLSPEDLLLNITKTLLQSES